MSAAVTAPGAGSRQRSLTFLANHRRATNHSDSPNPAEHQLQQVNGDENESGGGQQPARRSGAKGHNPLCRWSRNSDALQRCGENAAAKREDSGTNRIDSHFAPPLTLQSSDFRTASSDPHHANLSQDADVMSAQERSSLIQTEFLGRISRESSKIRTFFRDRVLAGVFSSSAPTVSKAATSGR